VVYIDLNMVRAGVVAHPQEWAHGGYREIQAPRRRYVFIDYQALGHLAGIDDFGRFQEAHRHWVEAALAEQGNGREPGWTESVAVGQKDFVRRIRQALGGMARGRSVQKAEAGWELREADAIYSANFEADNAVRLSKTRGSYAH
jgi:putative transposase